MSLMSKKKLHKTRQLRGRAKQAVAENVITGLGGAVQEQAEETVTQHNYSQQRTDGVERVGLITGCSEKLSLLFYLLLFLFYFYASVVVRRCL